MSCRSNGRKNKNRSFHLEVIQKNLSIEGSQFSTVAIIIINERAKRTENGKKFVEHNIAARTRKIDLLGDSEAEHQQSSEWMFFINAI